MLETKLYCRTSTKVEASHETVLHFMQCSPEAYLTLAGLVIEREIDRSDQEGSWKGGSN
jgi:hypothetical protein